MELVPGIVVADRFRLVRPLGHGGMGAVWAAHHISLDVPCALKFIHAVAAQSADLRARFALEAKAAARLRSPYVVQILDHGECDGSPYIAMELLEGEDLGQRLARCRVLAPREALTIVSQVGRALGKAHAAGLVHRDLKPANIFLARDEGHETAKVLDFGVAKQTTDVLSDSKTKTGALLGTPFYMSPEQARGTRELDSRSDLWSLAVITFQCLVGQLPFQSEALGDLLMRIIHEPLPVPSRLAAVPPGFDAWWARAAARDPAQRFQSAKELTDGLALALGFSLPASGMDSYVPPPGASAAPGTYIGPPSASPAGPPSAMVAQTASPVMSSSVAASATPRRRGALILAVAGLSIAAVGGGVAFVASRQSAPAPTASADVPTPTAAPSQTAAAPATSKPAEAAPSAAPSAGPAREEPAATGSSVPSVAAPATAPLPAARPAGAVQPSSRPAAAPKPAAPKTKKVVHDDGV